LGDDRLDFIRLRWPAVFLPVLPSAGLVLELPDPTNLVSTLVERLADQRRALDEASQIELGFPHDFFNKPMVKAFAYGGLRDLIDA
jgi:hypothetical protein